MKRKFITILLLILSCCILGCGSEMQEKAVVSAEAEGYYEAGRKALYGLDGVENNMAEAYSNFKKALEEGKTEANFYLGVLCDWYYYPGKDYAQAKAYYEACGDFPYAQTALGYLYLYGNGTEEDVEQAKELFEAAKEKGCVEANALAGAVAYYERDYAKALELFQKVVEEGSEQLFVVAARNNIGIMHYYGEGVEQDYGKAWEWYQKSADSGDSSAMRTLGNACYHGEGVEQDYGKAMEWYEKAIALGNADAMYTVANMYSSGEGVEQDTAKSLEWFEKAASVGHRESMSALGFIYFQGIGVETDYEKAFAWTKKAAEAEDADAMLRLAMMYENAMGVEEDLEKAAEWYEKSGY